jgi:ADP-heptose:LPS heptosyltransferase
MDLSMKLFKYRYRPVHAVCEKLLALAAPLISSKTGQPLHAVPLKVLVLKFGGMGEAVLARSLLEHIEARNPNISFDFLVEKRTLEMMTLGRDGNVYLYTPGADGMGKAMMSLLEIRRRKYDAVLDFEQHSLLTAAFARASSIPIRVGFAPPTTGSRGGMFTHPIELREQESMWSSFIQIGRVLDPELPESLSARPLPCSPASMEWLERWWSSHIAPNTKGPIVALHLGVGPSAQYRRWPAERFASFAATLSKCQPEMTVILTGSKSERPLLVDFKKEFPGISIDATGVGELEHTAALLQRCDLLVSADTGIMHLAAAMGTPTFGLFGPNTPACWAPVGKRATYVYPRRQACSPCINSYRRHIPAECTALKESACMWDISVQDVLKAARVVVRAPWFGTEVQPMSDPQHEFNVLATSYNLK